MMRTRLLHAVVLSLLYVLPAVAQHPWPVAPRHQTHEITGTFSEYRGPANPHFHNGVDVPKADGSPVYAVAAGTVTGIDPNGSNAYVRVDRYAYVHIVPHPALSVGDAVEEGDPVGTILSGQGHVHFTDGYYNEEREPLAEGRMTPYDDPWAPVVQDVQFYLQPTRQRLTAGRLTGLVEVSVRIRERNGPPGTASSRLNNGAHTVGYKVVTRDRQTEVFVPGDDGVVFHFDFKPSNAYVHHVFDQTRGASTSDQIYLPTNELTRRTGWDTGGLDGDYTLMLFAADVRGNADTAYVDVTVSPRDLLPPPQVTLHSVATDDTGRPAFAWSGGEADDLAGFRIYRGDEAALPQTLLQGEGVIGPAARSYTHSDPFSAATFFTVQAADTTSPANTGTPSDVYGAAPQGSGRRVLVVDGFDRHGGSGSWDQAWHWFAATFGEALAAHGAGFETCANEAVISGDINMSNYDAVFWLLGDESTADETFSDEEQALVANYLEDGGRLFVSGSEVAWDLDQRGSPADRSFLRRYLKVAYAGDDAENTSVEGTGDGPFNELSLDYGFGTSPYVEDYPDYYEAVEGGTAVMHYGNGRIAAVHYAGPFGAGDAEGQVFTMGFPFETIRSSTWQAQLAGAVLTAFFGTSSPAEHADALPDAVELAPPYPNPFRARATIPFALPEPARVRLDVFDLLGRRVAMLADAPFAAGRHQLSWNAASLAAGPYLVRLEVRNHDGTARFYARHVVRTR